MRKGLLAVAAMFVAVSALVFSSQAENVSLRGDYVEVRTASVFAGACHYNGEVVTTGRDAMMAWNVTSGKWQGVDLSGVRVMAIVSADANLGESNAARQSEIIIDSNASRTQALAMVNALKEKYAASLGNVVEVRSAPINFARNGREYAVVTNEAAINVEGMPNDLCCKMPNLVWYAPFVGLENRKVGYTSKAIYSGKVVGEPWSRSGENSAFYGTFSL
ncbi:MAG TPA: DUF1326 domain-containing protein [Pyrinomonadaceae bacterium]|jgi:uncharacterized protein DUF1326|nr:DUF1326 domain-containing protein [Pyrinomonadaceae bacterium]